MVVIATHPTRPSDILDFRFSSGPGVALALGSTIVWALFWVLNTKDRHDEAVRLFVNFLFACGYILVLMLALGGERAYPWQGLLGGVYIGLFEMGITFLVWLKALRSAKTTAHVVNLIYLVPFLSLLRHRAGSRREDPAIHRRGACPDYHRHRSAKSLGLINLQHDLASHVARLAQFVGATRLREG